MINKLKQTMFHDCINNGYHLPEGQEIIDKQGRAKCSIELLTSHRLLQQFVPNVSSTNQMLTHTRYNAICKLKVFIK